jgi:hypothetical protein
MLENCTAMSKQMHLGSERNCRKMSIYNVKPKRKRKKPSLHEQARLHNPVHEREITPYNVVQGNGVPVVLHYRPFSGGKVVLLTMPLLK